MERVQAQTLHTYGTPTTIMDYSLLTNYDCMGTVPFRQVVLFWKRVVEGGGSS